MHCENIGECKNCHPEPMREDPVNKIEVLYQQTLRFFKVFASPKSRVCILYAVLI